MNSASLCSLAGRYENPIPPRCQAPIDFLKIPAQESLIKESIPPDYVAMVGRYDNPIPIRFLATIDC